MADLLVFYRRKLLGTYSGEIQGDAACILRTPWPEGTGGYKHILACVLYNRDDQPAGLELYWDDGIELFPEFTPLPNGLPAPPPKKKKLKRTRMLRQLDLPL